MTKPVSAKSRTMDGGARRLTGELSDALNFLRGTPAQIVLFGHAISYLAIFSRLQPPYIPYIQNMGVVVFFFISGVVISDVIATRSSSFPQFLLDRAIRILTALVPSLVFVFLFDSLFSSDPSYESFKANYSILTVAGNVLMLVGYPIDYLSVEAFGSLRPVWTVNLELWLYAFFGFLMLSGDLGKGWVRILGALIFLASIPPVLSGFITGRGLGLSFVWLTGAIYYRLAVMDCFPLRGIYFSAFGLICCLYLIIACGKVAIGYGYDLRYSLTIAGACIFGIECYRALRLGDRITAAIGRFSGFLASYSYSLYLIHYTILAPIPIWLKSYPATASKYLALIVVILICNAAAYLFYLAFERRYRVVRAWVRSSNQLKWKLRSWGCC